MNNWLYEAQLVLDRAEDTLHDAEQILKIGLILATVNRSYYVIYYCIHALLLTEQIITKTHQGANVKFNELFIKTDKLPRIFAQWAAEAFELRQQADYDMSSTIPDDKATLLLQNAISFYKLSKTYLENLIQQESLKE